MPEISRFYGIVVYMFYSDHNPPHLHIEYQGYEAVIELVNRNIKGEFPRRALNMINEWMDFHEDELLENWNLSRLRKAIKKIEPLK